MRKSGVCLKCGSTLAVVFVLACKSEQAPPPPAPVARAFGVLAELRGEASLVAGTRRFALRAGERWYEARAGKLVENAAVGAAIAKEAATEVFLGVAPLVVGGEEHHEKHVRFTPAREELPLVGVATKIEVTRDGLEAWAYTHELETNVAFVRGTTITYPKRFDRVGPLPESRSPVSARLCESPHVADVAASDRAVFVLVTECSDLAPLRLAEYAHEDATPKDTQLQTRRDLGLTSEKLVVSRSGVVHVVGVRGKRLAIDKLVGGNLVPATHGPVSRVLAAVTSDDDAVWVLVVDSAGTASVVRDGKPIDVAGAPRAIAVDETLGVVVLAGDQLYAERPGSRVVITR